MINFDEEIKKFHPCLELDEARDAINGQDLEDVSDILVALMRDSEAMTAANQQMTSQLLVNQQRMAQQMMNQTVEQ